MVWARRQIRRGRTRLAVNTRSPWRSHWDELEVCPLFVDFDAENFDSDAFSSPDRARAVHLIEGGPLLARCNLAGHVLVAGNETADPVAKLDEGPEGQH